MISSQLHDGSNATHTDPSTPSSTTSGCISSDETTDGKGAVPATLITAENYLTLSEDVLTTHSVLEVTKAVEHCKELILDTPECSGERKWLVRRLIELRLRLQELKELADENISIEQRSEAKVVFGHHFVPQHQPAATTKVYCDHCCGLIWSVVQSWYRCKDCSFSCHIKCLPPVLRTCAHVTISENPSYILDINPESGLSSQGYRCVECKAHITFTFPKGLTCFGRPFTSENSCVEPRLCDYDGQYYCPNCHWNTTAVIPSRVVHNWDFEERRVCQASKQILLLLMIRPIIRLEDINPKLFAFVEELGLVKKIRQDILMMKKYLISCKIAMDKQLLKQLPVHFTENDNMYSLQNLIDIKNGKLLEELDKAQTLFKTHIKDDCKVCSGKGYFCELCEDGSVIFPFDPVVYNCKLCGTVFHRNCFSRKNQQCSKCLRIKQREGQQDNSNSVEETSEFY